MTDKPDAVTDERMAYLQKVGAHYTPRRHATVVAFMALKFGITREDAEDVVQYWLYLRNGG